jgi:hypothetical protein
MRLCEKLSDARIPAGSFPTFQWALDQGSLAIKYFLFTCVLTKLCLLPRMSLHFFW